MSPCHLMLVSENGSISVIPSDAEHMRASEGSTETRVCAAAPNVAAESIMLCQILFSMKSAVAILFMIDPLWFMPNFECLLLSHVLAEALVVARRGPGHHGEAF